MKLHDVRKVYDYNEWANARFLADLEALRPDQLTAHVESSFPSLLATMGHLIAAEWIWLSRWQGHNPTAFPEWLIEPTLEDLRARLRKVESERADFLAGLSQDDLETNVDYRNLSGTAFSHRLLDLLLHVANHSTYHRGQLTTMLRQVGASPRSTDYVLFLREE